MSQVISRVVLFTLFLALAVGAVAQVTITNRGVAAQTGPGIPATPVSPPVMFAPVVRLDQGPTQPIEANADNSGVATSSNGSAATVEPVDQQPFNFGVAQYGGFSNSGVGHDINGRSLGEIAHELQQRNGAVNARTYTNSDIENLKQGGAATGTTSQAKANDDWDPNNGVITPDNGQPTQNFVGAPSQPAPQAAPNPPVASPFAPRSQSYTPAGIYGKPSAQRPYATSSSEMARYDEQNAPLAQTPSDQNPTPNSPDTNDAKQLPHTASRLPLVGLAGLFTVTVGMFVRHQRTKPAR